MRVWYGSVRLILPTPTDDMGQSCALKNVAWISHVHVMLMRVPWVKHVVLIRVPWVSRPCSVDTGGMGHICIAHKYGADTEWHVPVMC